MRSPGAVECDPPNSGVGPGDDRGEVPAVWRQEPDRDRSGVCGRYFDRHCPEEPFPCFQISVVHSCVVEENHVHAACTRGFRGGVDKGMDEAATAQR